MDLIRISDTKLKIMLTPADMTRYDLHNDSVSFADVHTREVLRRLLADARMQTGFEGDASRLFVQMYPCADGGCELFISKPDREQDKAAYATLPALLNGRAKGRALHPAERHGGDMCAYSFSCLRDLCCVCRRLCSIGFSGSSCLYVDHMQVYYLFLRDFPLPSLYSPDEYCFLGEYGTRENARSMMTLLAERGTLICDADAVSLMAQL